jgi:putative oxidoreductase
MNGGETKLLFPGLSGFYATFEPIAYAILRFAVGATIFVHGWGKIVGGHAGVAGYFGRIGLPAPDLLAWCAMFLETVGAAGVAIGLFTRFFAAGLAIEILIALFAAHWASGFLVTSQKNGIEYVLTLGLVFFFIAIRGGGPFSVDAKIGKEL